jgi:hypothetical protein
MSAVAVRVTGVPGAKAAAHTPPHAMPSGVEATVPGPYLLTFSLVQVCPPVVVVAETSALRSLVTVF